MTLRPRSVRPSRESIDQAILDITAGLIARRGIKDTAVQAVADEAGYSKAGILNRFSSKGGLVEAAIAQSVGQARDLLRTVELHPMGGSREIAAIDALADLALHRPGWVQLVLAAVSEAPGDDIRERLTPVATMLMSAFGVNDQTETSLERRARVVAAIGSIAVLAVTYQGEATAAQAATLIRAIGWNTLGNPGPPPEPVAEPGGKGGIVSA